jgi:hypothetical protein
MINSWLWLLAMSFSLYSLLCDLYSLKNHISGSLCKT